MAIDVIQLSRLGITESFVAKGSISSEEMMQACTEQFRPSKYEQQPIQLENSVITRGTYRWAPMKDENGECCGMMLYPAENGSVGSFYATQLHLTHTRNSNNSELLNNIDENCA